MKKKQNKKQHGCDHFSSTANITNNKTKQKLQTPVVSENLDHFALTFPYPLCWRFNVDLKAQLFSTSFIWRKSTCADNFLHPLISVHTSLVTFWFQNKKNSLLTWRRLKVYGVMHEKLVLNIILELESFVLYIKLRYKLILLLCASIHW